MGYRDPREALQAENDALRQQIRDQERELDALRGHPEEARMPDPPRAAMRWGVGFASLGAVLPPVMLMLAATHGAWLAQARYHGMNDARMVPVAGGCLTARAPLGFERFTQSIERLGHVVEADNVQGVSPGARCTVRIAPVSMADYNCHVDVVCGDVAMYGGPSTGYAHCDVDGPRPVRAFDGDVTAGDGDPALSLDLSAGQALLLDRDEGFPVRVVLALDAPVGETEAKVAGVSPAASAADAVSVGITVPVDVVDAPRDRASQP